MENVNFDNSSLVAVITGDVISSRKHAQSLWSTQLKSSLHELGRESLDWEIFRGDAFQLLSNSPSEIFFTAMRIKAGFKSTKGLDLRMAIGIGDVSARESRVAESNGSAFIRSGALIDKLDHLYVNLAISSGDKDFDEQMNAGIAMASVLMDRWLPNYASTVAGALKYPEYNQSELGKVLDIAQNTVSERLGRANYRVLLNFDKYFRSCMTKFIQRSVNRP